MSSTSMEIVKATLDQGLSLFRSQAQAIVVSDQSGYIDRLSVGSRRAELHEGRKGEAGSGN